MPSGLDYFGARYFSAAQGRLTSPGPLNRPSASPKGTLAFLSNPQNWNKYAYVLNNPLIRVDPDGMADYLYIQSNVAKSAGASLTTSLGTTRTQTRRPRTGRGPTAILKLLLRV
uniref:RHS repeat-associated core domain-containing protein n=1 Tax=Solibacter usitatus (strain Ellin6076) TaxID=234267 RepID=Q02AI1_SOLUE